MSREDLASGILLLALALGMWWMACADRGDGSAWAATGSAVQPDATAGLYAAGRHAFRLSAPPGWAWTAAPPRSPALVGWRALGSFQAPPEAGPAAVRVDWLRLEREVIVAVPPSNGKFTPFPSVLTVFATPRSRRMSPPATRVHAAAGS